MKKPVTFAVVFLIWVVFGAVWAFAAQNVRVVSRNVADVQEDLQITGSLPEVSGLGNSVFQMELHSLIQQAFNDKVDAAKEDLARRIEFKYDYRNDSGYHSIILEVSTTVLSVRDEVLTFVFDQRDLLLTVNDVLGLNGVKIINQVIEQETSRRPGIYNPDFKGITETQSFYVDNGAVNVVFDKYAIGPAALGTPGWGTPGFPVHIAGVLNNTYNILRSDIHIKEPYNIRMIPLRDVAERLGFRVYWEERSRRVDITRRDSRMATFTIDINAYFKGIHPAVTLEYAPELIDGVTYLPISFFERILDACYTIDQAGSITFSYYNPLR